jgi:rhodanese-related sulfurtransferase
LGTKRARRTGSSGRPATPPRTLPERSVKRDAQAGRSRGWALLGGGLLVAVVAVVAVVIGVATLAGQPSDAGSPASPDRATVVQADGGQWTNITPDLLASMMKTEDFTLLNVKTPYVGEISGTDLYIPYTQLVARAAELPSDKGAPIVVYCRSGHESAIAAQALLDLGYTNIENLDGGMTAWVASGRELVQVTRS